MKAFNFAKVDTSKYQQEVKNEQTIINYIKQWGDKTGKELLTDILWLWNSKSKLSPAAIAVVVGAIGYFLAPVDLIPDAIPVLGFTDDAAIIAAAVKMVSSSLDPETRKLSERQVNNILSGKKKSK